MINVYFLTPDHSLYFSKFYLFIYILYLFYLIKKLQDTSNKFSSSITICTSFLTISRHCKVRLTIDNIYIHIYIYVCVCI